MFKKTNSKEFSAPRRKVGKEKSLSFSPNLASFAPLQLAPWNTDSTEVKLFARSDIPQGSPCGVLTLVEIILLGRAVTPRGESTFIRSPKDKFWGVKPV
jgi:hypothetical protein